MRSSFLKNNRRPLISIGLPVYNGAFYLEQALLSILAQTFADFELIVVDNCSTDATETIVGRIIGNDSRIRYYRNSSNIGAVANFNRVFSLAQGKYFKWAAHDDLIASDFLEKTLTVLENHDDVVLCHCKVHQIDSQGRFLRLHDDRLSKSGSADPVERFAALIRVDHWCYPIFGLIRSSALRATRMFGSHIGSDYNLLVELGLRGRFHQLDLPLFFARIHPEQSISALPLHRRGIWYAPINAGKIPLPRIGIFREYIRSLDRAGLTKKNTNRCRLELMKWLLRFSPRLGHDLVIATFSGLGRIIGKTQKNSKNGSD